MKNFLFEFSSKLVDKFFFNLEKINIHAFIYNLKKLFLNWTVRFCFMSFLILNVYHFYSSSSNLSMKSLSKLFKKSLELKKSKNNETGAKLSLAKTQKKANSISLTPTPKIKDKKKTTPSPKVCSHSNIRDNSKQFASDIQKNSNNNDAGKTLFGWAMQNPIPPNNGFFTQTKKNEN